VITGIFYLSQIENILCGAGYLLVTPGLTMTKSNFLTSNGSIILDK
jgi:hypothetical protein